MVETSPWWQIILSYLLCIRSWFDDRIAWCSSHTIGTWFAIPFVTENTDELFTWSCRIILSIVVRCLSTLATCIFSHSKNWHFTIYVCIPVIINDQQRHTVKNRFTWLIHSKHKTHVLLLNNEASTWKTNVCSDLKLFDIQAVVLHFRCSWVPLETTDT